jgi:predicted Zn-dependent protease
MKYTPRELRGNANVPRVSPVKEFFVLMGGLLGVLIAVYVVAGFSVDMVVARIPPELETALGNLYSETYGGDERTPAEAGLQGILDGLLEEKPGPEGGYRVHVLSHDRANALALPGGNIVVTSALLEEAGSENELAFVLAHELGHFANRDHLRGLGRGLVLLVVSAAFFGSDGSATDFLMNSLLTVEMRFSRRQESEADMWALDLLNGRYGHVAGALDFFSRVSEEEKRGRLKYFFSTHPYPEDRVEALRERIKMRAYRVEDTVPLDEALSASEEKDK